MCCVVSKNYDVCLPISGTIIVTVDADSEEEAIQNALDSDDLIIDNIESWTAHEHIVQGNIFYGERNDAEADLAFGEEEE